MSGRHKVRDKAASRGAEAGAPRGAAALPGRAGPAGRRGLRGKVSAVTVLSAPGQNAGRSRGASVSLGQLRREGKIHSAAGRPKT